LIYKGGILHEWGKKMVVVVHKGFFDTLPPLTGVDESDAEIAWMIYDFRHDETNERYMLERKDVEYTKFESALSTITTPTVGDMAEFMKYLKGRIKKGKTMGSPPPSQIAPDIEPLPELSEDNTETADEDEFTENE
jgi:hypothetical protein